MTKRSAALFFIAGFFSCFGVVSLSLLWISAHKVKPSVLGAISEVQGSVCKSIKLYRAPTWEALSLLDLENIKELDNLYFVAVPADSTITYDKARFRVQGSGLLTDWQETQDRNSEGFFYISYTLPPAVDRLTVEAELRNSQGKWQ